MIWKYQIVNYNYLALALILRRFRCNLRVRFFFHFQRILAVDFSKGLDSSDEEESYDPKSQRKGPSIHVKKSKW